MAVARTALPAFDGPYPQYNSIVAKGATVMGQVRSFQPDDSFDTAQVGRVGSSSKKTLNKSKSGSYTMELWIDSDLGEIAMALNGTAPTTAGDTVKLDPDAAAATFYIHTYDGEATDSTHLNTIYVYNALPTGLSLSYDEDGEQVATITGTFEDLYWKVNAVS